MIRIDPVLKIDLEQLLDISMDDDPHHPFVAWLPSTIISQHQYGVFQMRRRSRCGFWHPTNVEFLETSDSFSKIKRFWDNEVDKWIVNLCRTPRCLCLLDMEKDMPEIIGIAYFEKQREGHYRKEMSGA